jgi:uncharacterized protein (TIGR03437 family)
MPLRMLPSCPMKYSPFVYAAAILLFCSITGYSQRVITTIAGTDSSFSGDGKSALQAPLGNISGLAIDRNGNLLVADPDNRIAVRIDGKGILHVIAGNGIGGFSGDGGPATSASLSYFPPPCAIAVDGTGNIFISDNVRVRKVTPDGLIGTFAGGGQSDPGDGGPAPQAKLGLVTGIAMDGNGNVLIAETGNHRIRKIDANGIITTIAGNGRPGFSGDGGPAAGATLNGPAGISVDPQGNILITDVLNGRVRRITPDGVINTIVGGGSRLPDGIPGTSAELVYPGAAVADRNGTVYVFEQPYGVVKVAPDGRASLLTSFQVDNFGGDGGPSTAAYVQGARGNANGLALDDSGNLYVADGAHGRIRKIDSGGIITTIAGNGLFRFTGDEGPATIAVLDLPVGVATGPGGDIFISDNKNYRVRAVRPDGTIHTVAGSGLNIGNFSKDNQQATTIGLGGPGYMAADGAGDLYIADVAAVIRVNPDGTIGLIVNAPHDLGFSGDGGPARNAAASLIKGLALDPAGNLYFSDQNNHRVRRVTPDGAISTYAGTGAVDPVSSYDGSRGPVVHRGSFSGDGGPASQATLNEPGGLALDSGGNLYILDSRNERIRKVTPDGTISTIAGNGQLGPSGDGGPAIQASLYQTVWSGIVTGGDGTIYFSDYTYVRQITPDGIISKFAGTGTSEVGFRGDGGPPENALFGIPSGLALDSGNNLYIVDYANHRVRAVLAMPPSFAAIPSNLVFSGSSGGASTAAQTLTVSTSIPGMSFATDVATSDVGDWLSITPDSGASPRLMEVVANPFKLAAGSYSGTINLRVPSANPPLRSISVSLVVQAGNPPSLKLDKPNLSFTYPSGAVKRNQALTVSNAGGGSLDFAVGVITMTGGNWLSASPASGTAIPGSPVVLTVSADPSGLAAGTYTAKLTILGTDTPVTMTISAGKQAILLSQTGLSFTAVAHGSVVPPQSFGVLNIGQGAMNWTASTSTLAGGNWLQVLQDRGSTDAASDTVPTVAVRVDASGLDPGGYYGLVRVDAPAAANRSQVITVFLEVQAPDQDPGPRVEPSELVFTGVAGGNPSSKDLLIYNIAAGLKSYHAVANTENGGAWYVDLPSDATLALDAPTRLVVQPVTGNLAPGVYRGNLSFQFTDGRARNIGLKFIVAPLSSSAGANGAHDSRTLAPGGCTPTTLVPALTTLGESFSVSAGWPVALVVEIHDDCGNPLNSGAVSVNFSNGDPPLSMQSLKNGQWHQTWQTSHAIGSQITVTVEANSSDKQLKATRVITGDLRSPKDPPIVDRARVVSVANTAPFVALAPGALISISGDRLAEGSAQSVDVPLPQQLADAQVIIGGRVLPLSLAGPNQLNAVVPFDLETNTQHQLIVLRGNTYSQPIFVDVADSQPAIFTDPGSKQALIYAVRADAAPFLVTPANPAQNGDGLIVYAAGLGIVNPTVNAGDASPSPAASTVNAVQMNIGGADLKVDSTTLIPGMVSVYQVKATVPQGLQPGDAIPITIRVAGQTSPALSIALR